MSNLGIDISPSPPAEKAPERESKPTPPPWRVLLIGIALFSTLYIVASPFLDHQWQVTHETAVSVSTVQGRVESLRRLETLEARHHLEGVVGLQSAWVCLAVSVAGLAIEAKRS